MASNVVITPQLDTTGLRELGVDAVFTLSSAKPGNGVEQLRDDLLDTYWQSDGVAPHVINISFKEKKTISQISFYCDFALDESYAVKKFSVFAGSLQHDLQEIASMELAEPTGWISVPLFDPLRAPLADCARGAGGEGGEESAPPLRAHLLQLRVSAMHQNGRDTHIRQLKVFCARSSPACAAGVKEEVFRTVDMTQFSLIR